MRTLSDAHVEAELTLLDPTERARFAQESAERDRERSRKAADALAGWRSVLADYVKASNGLDPARRGQLERLAARQGLDAEVVRRELDAAPVAKMPEVLDEARRQRVRKALSELAQAVDEPRLALSLYHALGLDLSAGGAQVQERYETVTREANQRAHGTTATLYKNMLAEVKLLLIDADPRAYVEGLVLDVREEMFVAAAHAAASGNVIDAVEAEQLLRQAVGLGLTPELGRRVLNDLAKQNDVLIETGAAVDYVACPACNAPYPRSAAPAACARCGTNLFVVCPIDDCRTRNDATAARCAKCGTDLHRYTEATRRLAALPAALTDGRVAAAAAELVEISRVLGDAAVPSDLRRRVEDAERAAHGQWEVAESAIGARRLFAARSALRRLGQTAGDVAGPSGDLPAARAKEIERRLAELDGVLGRARAAAGAARERALVEALALAADCEEAATALDAIAPEPAGAVRVQMGSAGPAVTWAPSPTIAARYAVTRTDVGSGASTALGDTTHTSLDDRDAPTGAVVRYDVTTVRGTSRSLPSTSPPLTVAREVEGLSLADGDGEVRITWQPVPASARVLVFRRDARGGEEQELVADRSGIVDRSVRNGQRYGYHVRVEYAGSGGRTQSTEGLTVFGQPAPPPEGIEALTVHQLADGLIVEFAPPPVGSVTILRCDSEPTVDPGATADPTRLAELGRVLPTDSRGARDSAPSGICWYLPVTIAGGTAVIGRAHRHLALADIANVTAVERPHEVRVTWEWPDAVRIAKVMWRRDRQPAGPDDPDAESAWVRLGEYRDHGGFAIDARGGQPVFVAVVPGIRVDGALVAGTIIPRGARAAIRRTEKIDLRYDVRRTGMRNKRLEVRVHAPEGTDMPGLVLVARSGDLLPRHSSDGELLGPPRGRRAADVDDRHRQPPAPARGAAVSRLDRRRRRLPALRPDTRQPGDQLTCRGHTTSSARTASRAGRRTWRRFAAPAATRSAAVVSATSRSGACAESTRRSSRRSARAAAASARRSRSSRARPSAATAARRRARCAPPVIPTCPSASATPPAARWR